MQGIHISYRRNDRTGVANRLADHIEQQLPGVTVLRGAVTLAPGEDFVEAIAQALRSCDVMVVVIGPRWASATDANGRRNLDNAQDYVRLEIAAQTSAEAAQASGSAAHSAFASYSSQDRQRVLDRIDAVRIAAGLDIFLDCLSLKPSEQWKRRLDSEIRERDLFMLFWSAAAAQSQWVEWEWREALALKGLDAMQIQPLEDGVKPPPELEALHFGSVAMYARMADAARTQPGEAGNAAG